MLLSVLGLLAIPPQQKITPKVNSAEVEKLHTKLTYTCAIYSQEKQFLQPNALKENTSKVNK